MTLFTEIVIVGVGNPLFGDSGFGPAVIEEMQKQMMMQELTLPDNVTIIDAGLGGPQFIFPLLDPEVTKQLVIIDIIDFGGEPGDIKPFCVENFPMGAYRDAESMTLTESLHRLKDDINITVIGCQPKRVSSPEFEIGLSDEITKAIPDTIRIVLETVGVNYGISIKCLQERRSEETR